MTGQTGEVLSLSEQLVKPMEDLEGEYMPCIEMPVAGVFREDALSKD
jgi:hypothetical protein